MNNILTKEIMSENWKPFYFEGNAAWGYMETRDNWEFIKNEYSKESSGYGVDWENALKNSRRNDNSDHERYGLYSEYRGEKTLLDFFEENKMEW